MVRARGLTRRARIGACLVAGVLIAGCSSPAPGVLSDSTASGAGSATTASGAGSATSASVPVDPGPVPEDPALVLSDLSAYWAQAFPAEFGVDFTRLATGWVGIDGGAEGRGALCLSANSAVLGNAYYCPDSDGIVYDTGLLTPVLTHRYGPGALTASLAHEFGHAIANRIGPTSKDRIAEPGTWSNLYVELQADCYAGVFLGAAARGETGRTSIDPERFGTAIAPLLDFRDGPAVGREDLQAHGLAMDRLQAVLYGFAGSGAQCREMELDRFRITVGTPGLDRDRDAEPRFADRAALRAATLESLAMVDPVTAAAAPVTPPAVPEAAVLGQFADATGQVLAAYTAGGRDEVAAICHTGVWVGAAYGDASPGALGSRVGDADEALDLIRARTTSAAALAALADSFARGALACGER